MSSMEPSGPRQSDLVTGVERMHPGGSLGLAVLGATGSIGTQTLEVVNHHPDRFHIVALAAGQNMPLLAEQIRQYQPDLVAVDNDAKYLDLEHPRVLLGSEGLLAVATHPSADIVVVATSGHAAILPTLRAIQAGKTVALANKETIVCAGELILPAADMAGIAIRPVDSEHSAIWQSLGRSTVAEVSRLILTASGGPFRETALDDLSKVTIAQALAHPTWAMGGKITIDSATLMNKGLEVIEAHWLFGVPYDNIDVVIHPESIVHSLVEFVDGSQIAQLSLPDMRLPIQYALTYPEHTPGPCRRLSLAEVGVLRFSKPDPARFPALALAREAGLAGSTYPTVLSSADEAAVEAFLAGRLPFSSIVPVVSQVLHRHRPEGPLSLESVLSADCWARQQARTEITSLASRSSSMR